MGLRVRLGCAVGALAAIVLWPVMARAEQFAPTPMSASEIFAKSRAANGDLAPGTYRTERRFEGGGIVTTSLTLSHGNDFITTVQSGDFSTAAGSFNGQSWHRDENGIVLLNRGVHDDSSRKLQHALDDPADPAAHVRVLGLTTDNPSYVVEQQPDLDIHQKRYYDGATFLLTRVDSIARTGRVTATTYADFRKTFGRETAFTTHSSDGRLENETTSTITPFVAAKVPTAALSIPSSHSLLVFSNEAPIVIPTRVQDGRFVIRLMVAGRGLDFMLDTGASVMTIDPGVAKSLNLLLYGKSGVSIGGDLQMSRTRISDATIGDLHLRNVVFHTVPMTDQAGDSKIVGLLGLDFLASAVFEIDLGHERLTAIPPGAFDSVNLGASVPVELDDGIPRLAIRFAGTDGHFALDYGADQTDVYQHFIDHVPERLTFESGNSLIGHSVGGTFRLEAYTMRDLYLGTVHFETAPVLVPVNAPSFEFPGYDGLLGRNVLRNFDTFLDYGHGKAYFCYDQF